MTEAQPDPIQALAPPDGLRVLWILVPCATDSDAAVEVHHALAATFHACRAQQCRVLLVTGACGFGPEHDWPALGVPRLPIDAISPNSSGVVVLPQLRKAPSLLEGLAAWRITKLREAFAPHVVHTHGWYSALVLGASGPDGTALVHTVADARSSWPARLLERRFLRRCDALVGSDVDRHDPATALATTWLTAYRDAMPRAAARLASFHRRTRATPHLLDWLALPALAHGALLTAIAPFVPVIHAPPLPLVLAQNLSVAIAGIAVCAWRLAAVRHRWFREACATCLHGYLFGAGMSIFGLLTLR